MNDGLKLIEELKIKNLELVRVANIQHYIIIELQKRFNISDQEVEFIKSTFHSLGLK